VLCLAYTPPRSALIRLFLQSRRELKEIRTASAPRRAGICLSAELMGKLPKCQLCPLSQLAGPRTNYARRTWN